MRRWRRFKSWYRRRKNPEWGRYVLEERMVAERVTPIVPRGWQFVPLKPRTPRPLNRRGHW